MKKLQYLNIDELEISGDNFIEACKEFQFKNKCFPPLRYLSIEEINNKEMTHREWSYTVD